MHLQHIASAWYSLESMVLSTHLLFKDSQQNQMDDHLVWFAATVVESKLSIDSVGVSLYVFPRIDLSKQIERSFLGKSFVFVTYKYEWSIVDNDEICLRNENEIPLGISIFWHNQEAALRTPNMKTNASPRRPD